MFFEYFQILRKYIKYFLYIDKLILPIYDCVMENKQKWVDKTAEHLGRLYDQGFGGKASGRYRIPAKLLRDIAGRRRLYEDDIRDISRALIELGFVLIDMDSFYVVTSSNSFVNYRRVNDEMI